MKRDSAIKSFRIAFFDLSISIFFCFLFLICLGMQAAQGEQIRGQINSEGKIDSQMDLARQQFEFQKEIENRKLGIEKQKAWLTGGSILLPLVLGSFGVYLQVRSAFKLKGQELRKAQELKELEFRSAFELKVAEIVLNSTSPRVGKNKAEALQGLFPNRLPDDFADKLQERILVPTGTQRPLAFEHTQILIQMLVDNIGKEREVIGLWRKVYPYYQAWLDLNFPQEPTE